MILLWLIVILLTLLVVALLLWPLMGDQAEAPPDRAGYDLTVYRDQLAEIDRDVARGLLSAEQADSARLEIQRRMLSVADDEGSASAAPDPDIAAAPVGRRFSLAQLGSALSAWRTVIPRARAQGAWGLATLAGIGAVLPFGVLAVYLILGSPELPSQPYAERLAREEERLMQSLPEGLREALVKLESRVEADPDNPRLLLQLGRAYGMAQLPEKAAPLLEKARTLATDGPVKAAILIELAETLIMTHEGQITDRIRALFLDGLRLTPEDPRARFYLGVAAVQDGHPERAIAIWRDLVATSNDDDAWMPMVRQNMGMVAQENGIPPATVAPLHPLNIEAGEPVIRLDVPPPEAVTSPDTGTQPEAAPGEAEVTTEPDADAPSAGDSQRAEADASREPGQDFNEDEQAMIEGMVASLAARLEENPDDLDGWQQLARSYRVMGRLEDAADAMGRAVELAPDDMSVLSARAEALIAAARARGDREPPQAIYGVYSAILAQDPDNPNALYFVGRQAAEAGDSARARKLWGRLLQRIPPDEPAHASLRAQIDALPEANAPPPVSDTAPVSTPEPTSEAPPDTSGEAP